MQPEAYERLWGVRRLKFFRVLNRRSQSGPGVSADLPNRFLRSVRAASVMSMFVLGYPRLVHTLIHWYKTSSSVSLKTTGWLWWSLCSGFFLSLNRVVALTFHLAAAFRDDNPAELSPIASFNLKQRAKNWFEEEKNYFSTIYLSICGKHKSTMLFGMMPSSSMVSVLFREISISINHKIKSLFFFAAWRNFQNCKQTF